MDKKDLAKLQNGSDIRGVATEGAGEAVTLTENAVYLITLAFVKFLSEKLKIDPKRMTIAVGHDSRISAPILNNAVVAALIKSEVFPIDTGLSSTPAMFMATQFDSVRADGAIMLTASHLPYQRNGMKFFTAEGGAEKEDIRKILEIASAAEEKYIHKEYEADYAPLMTMYARHLRGKIIDALGEDMPLDGMKIVIDAGNGAGGFFAYDVLIPLGAEIKGSVFLEPDGNFPNHIPNPEDKTAMAAIKKAVKNANADLGIIFDTDVDRMSAVLSNGEIINRNALIAMMSAILAKDYPRSTIVTDSVTSDELTDFLEGLGLKHHRFKRGYKNVINECKRLNESGVLSPLAIETSGHGALNENYYLDDGAYLAIKLIIAAARAKREGKDLSSLIADLKYPLEEKEIRIKILTEDFKNYGENALKIFEQRAKESEIKIAAPSYEGVRLIFPHGFALLRMSLHDPILPLNMESRKAGGVDEILTAVKNLLNGFDKLKF